MDDARTVRGRILTVVAIPISLLLLLPLALLFAAWFYGIAAVQGVWMLIGAAFRKKAATPALQKPHFAETRSETRTGQREQ